MPKHACGTCGKEFPDSAHLKRHLANKKPCIKVNPEDKNKCILCDKTFSCLSNLYKHRNRFHPEIAENRRIANDLALRQVTNNDVQAAVLPVADNDVQAHDEQLPNEAFNDWDDENGEWNVEADETQLVVDQPHIVNESNFFKFGDKKIRKTQDAPRRVSVFDLIAAITDQYPKNAVTTFLRMKGLYPDIETQTFQFPGRGQRETPIANYENCRKIVLAVLSGVRLSLAKKNLVLKVWGFPKAALIKAYVEEETLAPVVAVFAHLHPIKQFSCGQFRIDLYFPDQKVALECDEHDHIRYDSEAEADRQRFIEAQLCCVFVRYNPQAKDFSVFALIARLMPLLMTARRVE